MSDCCVRGRSELQREVKSPSLRQTMPVGNCGIRHERAARWRAGSEASAYWTGEDARPRSFGILRLVVHVCCPQYTVRTGNMT